MEQRNERKPETSALVAQLEQLNERSRWYSSRLWQEPLTFFGIVALAVSSLHEQTYLSGSLTLVALAALGFVLHRSINSMKRAQKDAVDAVIQIEDQLGLKQATKPSRGVSPPIQELVRIVSVGLLVVSVGLLVSGLLVFFGRVLNPTAQVSTAVTATPANGGTTSAEPQESGEERRCVK